MMRLWASLMGGGVRYQDRQLLPCLGPTCYLTLCKQCALGTVCIYANICVLDGFVAINH